MTETLSQTFATRRFRAGSAYELAVFDRLPPQEQILLAELRKNTDFYGILRPKDASAQTVRAVDKDTALLWLTLQTPGALPFFVWSGGIEKTAKEMSLLVLDRVLEIEREDGVFVSGAAASELITAGSRATPKTRLAQLSCEALRYGESLKLDNPQQLTGRLYGFGRQPITPAWAHTLPDTQAVLDFLCSDADSQFMKIMNHTWGRADHAEKLGWIVWSACERQEAYHPSPRYKLYISPTIEDLPKVFQIAARTLAKHPALEFKIGCRASGLLRPDKFMVYFHDLEQLLNVCSELTPLLHGITPHGVAFSAEIAHDGLLSWGMDPPASERAVSWQEQESWRLWVVRRLASAMISAQKETSSAMPAWQFALERLRLMGIDVEQWTPSSSIW